MRDSSGFAVRSLTAALILAGCAALASCGDGGPLAPVLTPAAQGVVLSQPLPVAGLSVAGVAIEREASGAFPTDSVVYVSLTPGTEGAGEAATIANLVNGLAVGVTMQDGGFDPVPVPAVTGDSLVITVLDASGLVVATIRTAVRPARPPVVVRTDPPPHKTDVPLNAVVGIVFSEPMDSSVVSAGALGLLRGTAAVTGTARFTDGSHLSVTFTPDQPLSPGTAYRLFVSGDVRDLAGQSLGVPDTVAFATGAGQLGQPDSIWVSPSTSSVAVGGTLRLAAVVRDTSGNALATPVTWSSSDASVATVSTLGVVSGVAPGAVTITVAAGSARGHANISVGTGAAGSPWTAVVRTTTTGVVPDTDGYVAIVDGAIQLPVRDGQPAIFRGLSAGSHTVRLAGLASNCSVVGAASPNATFELGDTTTFWVSCTTPSTIPGQIAYWIAGVSGTIAVMDSDGSNQIILSALDASPPMWTPDGAHILFARNVCDWDGSNCQEFQGVLGGGAGQVPPPLPGFVAGWSHDGATIAYVRHDSTTTTVVLVNADGTAPRDVFTGVGAGQASFAPNDGSIAFDCEVDAGNWDICAVRTDGTGLLRLTSDPDWDGDAAWSPDGLEIAFTTHRFGDWEIVTMQPDGTGLRRVSPGTQGYGPSWSPDGTRIAFGWNGIFVMLRDGSQLRRLSADGSHPAWRPGIR